MALRLTLSKRLLRTATDRHPSYPVPIPPPPPTKPHLHRDSASSGLFRRASGLPSFLTLTVGEKLREKLNSLHLIGDYRLRLDGLSLPPRVASEFGLDVSGFKRIVRCLQMEKVRERLRNIPASTIPFVEFAGICGDVCGDTESGLDCAKALNESGNVIVLGEVVFLRPNQVTKCMEKIIFESIAMPNDPRRKELEGLQVWKAEIDRKAEGLVKMELYSGLGFLVLQTLGFIRLTFWELSWDVMEPICFFVTSLHFAFAYLFFIRTSIEPSFLGYFQARFKLKQRKLMQIQNFDLHKYNHLSQLFYTHFKENNA